MSAGIFLWRRVVEAIYKYVTISYQRYKLIRWKW